MSFVCAPVFFLPIKAIHGIVSFFSPVNVMQQIQFEHFILFCTNASIQNPKKSTKKYITRQLCYVQCFVAVVFIDCDSLFSGLNGANKQIIDCEKKQFF